MSTANDWDINYASKLISHIDGVLTYSSGSGTQPSVGEYIRGGTSGAVGKVLSRTGNATAGTLTLTNVVGQFASGEAITILSELDFDGVTAGNGGFKVGDTLVGNGSAASIVVMALEYNMTTVAGWGKVFGAPMTGGPFTNPEQLNISGGQADVADTDSVGTDNDAKFSATTDAALAVPGTANTNNCVIVHYDGGTIAIPADAKIADASTGAYGYAQAVFGSTATGSIRVIDSNTTGGAWTNNNTLNIQDVVFYKTLVAGKVFSVGDLVKGATSLKYGTVLAVIVDTSTTGKLILARKSGAFTADEEIHIKVSGTWTKYANVDGTTAILAAATINTPAGVRSTQRAAQGGIFASGSLNLVRSANAVYTYIMDTLDELSQLDDTMPIRANVKDQLYTLTNGWKIPDLSFRFMENGSWQDSAKANIWTNYQSLGSIADIGNHGFFYSTTGVPTPQPNLYVEQDGVVLSQFWLEGNVNVNIKVKTNTDPQYIDPTVASLGQLINSGTLTWFASEYLRTYDHFQLTKVGGTTAVPLATANDPDNTTGTHDITYTGAGGFTVGEEIVGGTSGARGIVTAENTTTNHLYYVLKTSTQFSGAETITGQASGATCDFSSVANLVAGYGTDIRIMTVDRYFTGGTAPSGDFVPGELCTQAGSTWEGYYMSFNSTTDRMYFQNANANTPGAGVITGSVSTKTYDPSSDTASLVVVYDLGDGSGKEDYSAGIAANITNASAQTILKCYEWAKYLCRKESTALQGGPGATASIEGRIYRGLNNYSEVSVTTWAEDKVSPWGHFAGGKMFGARGVFIIKETLATADIQNFKTITNAGSTRTPPNLQAIVVSVPEAGVRVAVYRVATEGSTTIQRSEFKVGTVGAGNNQAGDSTILVAANDRTVTPLPADVPSTGVVKVLSPNGTGNYISFPYTSVDRATNIFTLSATIGTTLVAAGEASADLVLNDNAHVVFKEIESSGTTVSATVQYISSPPTDAYLFWVARKKGYLPAEGPATFSSTGASIASNMQTDDVVNMP